MEEQLRFQKGHIQSDIGSLGMRVITAQLPTVATATTRRHLGRHRFHWNHHTSFFPFRPTATSIRCRGRRKQPRNEAVLTDFHPTFGLSFSLISPPNLTRYSDHAYAAGGTLSGSGSVGLLVEFLGKCSIYRGDFAKIFGRKSRFLVSGPRIGEMSHHPSDGEEHERQSEVLGRFQEDVNSFVQQHHFVVVFEDKSSHG
ncbi:hypothetical protein L3X38_003402 [Prunus dulcis]|uniref:Uncharacterized protein n=1 Tax=Prunus dulcis TaxID=3755 RepID=A0AAD4ZLZ9_PRUDU|nr:hypothetical protein L3X38_003402 [Prunus dulcis]